MMDLIDRRAAIGFLENCEPGEELFMIESLPSIQPSPCEFCTHNDTSEDVACLRCSAERRTDG